MRQEKVKKEKKKLGAQSGMVTKAPSCKIRTKTETKGQLRNID